MVFRCCTIQATGQYLFAPDGIILSYIQVAALERKKEDQQSKGEIETHHPGYLGEQDTYYDGYIKGVGRSISKPLLIPIAV